ncbi:autotransporter outer membrane beta-barrel domain-containing protein [Enterobacter cloacae complex sp. 2024EL-00215]|uniref:autotransporter outer membrane beta-barrel domain-containing protein n=1 Tax=unclassified Enterobacter cloacae complex TaxID=2757714 RepID=UPI00374FE3BD
MNKIYSIVWSAVRNMYVVTSELACGDSKLKTQAGVNNIKTSPDTQPEAQPALKAKRTLLAQALIAALGVSSPFAMAGNTEEYTSVGENAITSATIDYSSKDHGSALYVSGLGVSASNEEGSAITITTHGGGNYLPDSGGHAVSPAIEVNNGAQLTLYDATVEADGEYTSALNLEMGGQAELHGGEVSGNGDYLLIGLQNQSRLTLDSVDVTATAGTYSGYMPNAQSIYVQEGSHLIIENGSNLQLGANQINLSQGSTLDMSDSTVTTASAATDSPTIFAGASTVNITDSSVTNDYVADPMNSGYGSAIQAYSGSTLTLTGTTVTSNGIGIVVKGSTANITGSATSNITADNDAIQVTGQNNTLKVHGATVNSSAAAALHVVSGATLTNNDAIIIDGNSTFTAPTALQLDSDVAINASDSTFDGNIVAGKTASTLDFNGSTIKNGSVTASGSHLSLDDSSTWTMADDTIADTLGSLDNAGTITMGGNTLAITNGLTLQSTSVLNIAQTDATTPLITTKDAALDGTLYIHSTPSPQAYTSDTELGAMAIIIDAQNAIVGDFDSVTIDAAAATPDYLTYSTGINPTDNTQYTLNMGLTWYADGTHSASGASGNFTLDAGDTFTVTGTLANQTGNANWDGKTLTKEGDGALTLAGNNTYTGGTTINGGTLTAASANALGTGAVANHATLVLGAGDTVNVTGGITTYTGATTTLAAGTTLDLGSSAFTQQDGSTLNIDLGASASSPIITAGSANLDGSLNITGIGNVTDPLQNNPNTFTLIDANSAISGDFDNLTIAGIDAKEVDFLTVDGRINASDSSQYQLAASLSWYADLDGAATDANGTFTLSNPDGSFNVAADLADVDSSLDPSSTTGWDGKTLTKEGGGELILSGNNSYSGGTDINDGTLTAASVNALGTGEVTNHASLVLDAGDTINATGGITTDTGATTTLAAGTSLDLGSGTLTQQSGSTLDVELGSTSAQQPLIIGDSATLDGTLQVGGAGMKDISSDAHLETITLMDMDNAIGGDFTSLSMDLTNSPDYLTVSGMVNPDDDSQYLLTQALSWNATTTSATPAHGTFTLDAGKTFEVTSVLSDQTGNANWDGKTLTKAGKGTLVLSAENTYNGDTHVNDGTLWLTDTGVIGATSSTQNVNVASGATFGGTGTVNGNVNNSGSIAMSQNGETGHTLTINGDYRSTGGSLYMNTYMGDDNSTTDKLVISGDVSGTTAVTFTPTNSGDTGMATTNGIEVIDVGGTSVGGSGNDASFQMQGRVMMSAYEYRLYQHDDGNWYLNSTTLTPTPSDDGGDGGDVTPQYRADIGAYLGNQWMVRNLQMQTLYDREGSQYHNEDGSVWMRFKAGTSDSQAADGNVDINNNYSQFQLGGDVLTWSNGEQSLAVGGMGSYVNADTDSTGNKGADGSQFSAKGHTDGYNLGVYATWFADAKNHNGMYVDSWYQYGFYNNSVDNDGIGSEDYDSSASAISLETGYRYDTALQNGNTVSLTPQAQATWQHYSADSLTDHSGTRIDDQDSNSWNTRLGLRVDGKLHNSKGSVIQPFMEANWLYTSDDTSVSFNDMSVDQDIPANRAELKVGIKANLNSQWSVTGQVMGQKGNNDYSDLNGSLNVRYNW